MKTLRVLGLVLCWTLLCSGDDTYNANNGEPPDADANLVDLLKHEELFLDKNTDLRYYQTGSRNYESEDPDEPPEKGTCEEESDCKYEGTCTFPDGLTEGPKFCKCKSGLSGAKCEIIEDCDEQTGKYKNCKEETGSCEYDVQNEKAVCNCINPKKLNPKKQFCEECDCGEHSIDCTFKEDGSKKCACIKDYSQDNEGTCTECTCGAHTDTCNFDPQNTKICTCQTGFALKEEVCKATCEGESDCEYGGTCTFPDGLTEGPKFCKCKRGLSGAKCEIIEDCDKQNGKYKNCKEQTGSCEYDVQNEKAVCNCTNPKKLNPKKQFCEECDCGEHSTDCTFKEDGSKKCACKKGYSPNNEGICTECMCGDQTETCEFGTDNVKICTCKTGFILHEGECTECNCGEKATECTIKVDGAKECTCQTGYAQNSLGKCAETCKKEEDCQYSGTCRIEGEDENGDKFCECKSGLSGDKCENIDACLNEEEYAKCSGDIGECGYDVELEKAVCNCTDKEKRWNPQTKSCQETCKDDDQCDYEGICEGEEEEDTFCSCNNGLSGANCTIIVACITGKYKLCKEDNGKCEYDLEDKEAVCICPERKALNPKTNMCEDCYCGDKMESCHFTDAGEKDCQCKEGHALKEDNCAETCDDDCQYGSTCTGKEGAKFCDCKTGLSGAKCDIIDDCKTGIYKDCKGDCKYLPDNETAVCNCPEGKELNPKNICSAQCSNNEECHGGECNDKFCACPEDYSGDFCEVNAACVAAGCEQADADCTYHRDSREATCICRNTDFVFNKEKKDCKTPAWCTPNPCEDAECSLENGVGVCKCKEDHYYNYHANQCEKINPCVTKGVVCDENKVCNSSTGECECMDGYLANGEECEPNFCANVECFPGAECLTTKMRGIVKCACDEKSFYLKGKCLDGSCFLDGYRRNCTKDCPSGMEKKEGDCVPKEGNECDDKSKDCGYGWCVKTKQGGKDRCICKDSRYTQPQGDISSKCVLKKTAVCPPSAFGDDPMTCNCTGMYKFADNEVTCEKRGCADDDVVEECNSQRGICKDYWKQHSLSYNCTCPAGQWKDDGVCKDTCSTESAKETCREIGQSCFIGENGALDCKCPPARSAKIASEEKTCEFDPNNQAYMLNNLPVQSEKYMKGDAIDTALLSDDIINAMNAMFSENELNFARLYKYRKDNDVFLCDVWLDFQDENDINKKRNKINRWTLQKLAVDGITFLPPALVLKADRLDKVKHEELNFCSETISKSYCGQGSTCVDNKCSCKPGYKAVESINKKSSGILILRCEDIDECMEKPDQCPDNTKCVNTIGDYYCKCMEGYKKSEGPADEENKKPCTDLCDPNPCVHDGICKKENNTVDCTCKIGYTGSFCKRQDENLLKANKSTVVVGAILGTLLGVLLILFLLYVRRQRKNSYSEDFTPAPRMDNAEMVERRPMRGATNKAYM